MLYWCCVGDVLVMCNCHCGMFPLYMVSSLFPLCPSCCPLYFPTYTCMPPPPIPHHTPPYTTIHHHTPVCSILPPPPTIHHHTHTHPIHQAHDSASAQEKAAVWQEERRVSKYAPTLEQLDNGRVIPSDPSQWRCDETGVTENLWLNLSTGFIGSGRQVCCEGLFYHRREGNMGAYGGWKGGIWGFVSRRVEHGCVGNGEGCVFCVQGGFRFLMKD